MITEARVTPIWKRQKFFLALFLLGAGGYFFFDGFVGYPRSNERWLAYEQFRTQENLEAWPAHARERHWTQTPPHKFYDQRDLAGQMVFGVLFTLLGGVTLVYWLGQKDRFFKMDQEAIVIPSGARVEFGEIVALEKKKWDSKGLAKASYRVGAGRKTFMLDDYKFDAKPIRRILEEIEHRMGPR
jgi:hypothetical protein